MDLLVFELKRFVDKDLLVFELEWLVDPLFNLVLLRSAHIFSFVCEPALHFPLKINF